MNMEYQGKRIDYTLLKLLVFALPILFYMEVVILVKVSLSDFVIAIALFWIIGLKENYDIMITCLKKYWLLFFYMFFLIYFCTFSMLGYFDHFFVDIPYGMFAIVKLSINFLYVLLIVILLEKYKEELLSYLLKAWKQVAFIISMLCIVGVVLYQMGIETFLSLGSRAQATLDDPNMTALFLIISFSLIAVFQSSRDKTIVFSFPMLTLLAALLLTASRGGIISFTFAFVVVLLLGYMSGKVKEFITFVTFASIILAVVFVFTNQTEAMSYAMNRVTEINAAEEGTSYRMFLWNSAFEMWKDNPVIGVGIGQFVSSSVELLGFAVEDIPHNTYLTFMSETGVLGFAAFIWFPVYLLFALMNGLIKTNEKKYFYLLIGLLALLVQAFTINVENFRFVWIFLVIIYLVVKNDFFQTNPSNTTKENA
jgi:O-antigen ligase